MIPPKGLKLLRGLRLAIWINWIPGFVVDCRCRCSRDRQKVCLELIAIPSLSPEEEVGSNQWLGRQGASPVCYRVQEILCLPGVTLAWCASNHFHVSEMQVHSWYACWVCSHLSCIWKQSFRRTLSLQGLQGKGGEGQLIMGKKFFYHSCRKIFLSIHSWMIFTLGTAQEKKKCWGHLFSCKELVAILRWFSQDAFYRTWLRTPAPLPVCVCILVMHSCVVIV